MSLIIGDSGRIPQQQPVAEKLGMCNRVGRAVRGFFTILLGVFIAVVGPLTGGGMRTFNQGLGIARSGFKQMKIAYQGREPTEVPSLFTFLITRELDK